MRFPILLMDSGLQFLKTDGTGSDGYTILSEKI